MRLTAALALLLGACYVVPDQRPPTDAPPPDAPVPPPPVQRAPPPPPPAPPPPAVRPMTQREALDRAGAFCRERGYDCRRANVERLGTYWRVRLDAASPQREGLLFLDFDSTSHALVRADEPPVRPPPAPPPPPVYVPPPAPRPAPARPTMTRDEAITRGLQACRERGFTCDLVAATRGGDIWLVDFDARRGYLRGPLHLGFDAWTRDLVAIDEPRPAPAPAPAPPPPGPRPAPAPRAMSFDEATARGAQVCRERGYACRLVDAALAGDVWRMRFEAERPGVAGRMYVEVDAFTRGVVRLDEPRSPAYPPPQAPPPARPPPPAPQPPPAPPPGPMGAEEATRFGLDYCRSRGFTCAVREQQLVRDRSVWKLHLEALPPSRGHVKLDVDAARRTLLHAHDDVHREGH